jgi:hypothetical protein
MSCAEARERLPLYVGGDLDSEVLDALRAHLDACVECARAGNVALRARRELVSALRSSEVDERVELWPGIRAALRTEGLVRDTRRPHPAPSLPARVARPRWSWALVPAAAAALLLVFVQVSGVLSRGTPPERTPELSETQKLDGIRTLEYPVRTYPVASGGLQRVDPREPLRSPQIYRPIRPGANEPPSPNDISLTGLHGYK